MSAAHGKLIVHGLCPACGAFCRLVGPVWAPAAILGDPEVHEHYSCSACGSTRIAVARDPAGRPSERHVIDVERRVSWTTMADP